ncbi:LIM/homeobox protein Lhx3-like [Chrysoperla carnea]|uniref:LIM/homeobox protein Lhx3-like n=1 Tax=Chrysoperla carnea TaxID=189513 RepID=UPI001D096269|nr:LIM/homeobox protein Lhx3-like [Chrysoperla carnea]
MHSTENVQETEGGEKILNNISGICSRTTVGVTNNHSTTTTTSDITATTTSTVVSNGRRICAGCGKHILQRFLLKALDLYWHEDCLKCGCCDCRLGEVGSTLYTKANLILCKRDYLRLFGTTGYCAACNKVIPAFEMVMRAKNNVYHLECFACHQCNHRFCVGDRFYLCENKVLCEYDYGERLVFANMSYNPTSLAHIRRQVSSLQPSTIDENLSNYIPTNDQLRCDEKNLTIISNKPTKNCFPEKNYRLPSTKQRATRDDNNGNGYEGSPPADPETFELMGPPIR